MKKILLVFSIIATQFTLAQQPGSSQTTSRPVDSVAQSSNLRIPVGVGNAAFDITDSLKEVQSERVQSFLQRVQITRQDTLSLNGLLDLPMPSLSEVTARLDYFAQLRLLRYGMLMINNKPDMARIYGAKLYILSEEVFSRKAYMDSLSMARQQQNLQVKAASISMPETNTTNLSTTNSESVGTNWFLLLIISVVGGAYYIFVLKPMYARKAKPATEKTEPELQNASNTVFLNESSEFTQSKDRQQ
jgi:hypothetical protein